MKKKVQRKKNFNFKISQLPFWNYLNESQMKCTFFRILIHFYLPVLPFWITLFQNSKHVLFWTNMKRLTTTTTLMYLQQHYHCKGHILPEYKSNLRYNLLIFRVKKLKILCIYFSGKQTKSKRIIIIIVGIIFTD